MLYLGALLLGCVITASGYTVKEPTITYLNPGIRFSYNSDSSGISLVAFHFSINSNVRGTSPAHVNVDVRHKTGNAFVYENRNIRVSSSDTVHYWVYVIYNRLGYTLTDRSWKVSGGGTNPGGTNPGGTNPGGNPGGGTGVNPGGNPGGTSGGNSGGSNFGNGGKHGSRPLGTASGHASKAGGCRSYPCLVFEDTFNSLDTNVWEHVVTGGGGGNNEFQIYHNDRRNTYVKNNQLYIKPTLTKDKYDENFVRHGTLDLWKQGCNSDAFNGCVRKGDPNRGWIVNPILSGRMRTKKSFTFKYGRVEVEARMPTGDWIWPAIWLLPKSYHYGGWPRSGEIDMVEVRSNRKLQSGGRSVGVDMMGSTLHWGPSSNQNGQWRTHVDRHAKNGQTFGNSFHKYGLEWTDQHIKMFLDGEEIGKFDPGSGGFYHLGKFYNVGNLWANGNKMAPFDQEFYLILNVAVGGTTGWWGDSYYKPWNNKSGRSALEFYNKINEWLPTWNQHERNGEDAAMIVKSVRVWQLAA